MGMKKKVQNLYDYINLNQRHIIIQLKIQLPFVIGVSQEKTLCSMQR